MNAITQNDNDTQNDGVATMPLSLARTHPFYWSVRRELWEHRAIWMAPLIAAALILLSFLVNMLHLKAGVSALAQAPPQELRMIATGLFGGVAVVIALTMITVTWFYCLDALYSERKDRSILFWKSLPVSDVTTVTSKLFVASAVAPSIGLAIVVGTQFVILLLGSAIILFAGGSPGALWTSISLLHLATVSLYFLVTQVIWFAPLTTWLILVSASVRRSPSLWSLLIPAGVCLVERIALGTSVIYSTLKTWSMSGYMHAAFTNPGRPDAPAQDSFNLQLSLPSRIVDAMDPIHFLSTPSVWVGLAIAAAFVAATVWMRRYREPL